MKELTAKEVQKHNAFVRDLENLFNTYGVYLTADREENICIQTVFEPKSYVKLHQNIYKDLYLRDHTYYEIEVEL